MKKHLGGYVNIISFSSKAEHDAYHAEMKAIQFAEDCLEFARSYEKGVMRLYEMVSKAEKSVRNAPNSDLKKNTLNHYCKRLEKAINNYDSELEYFLNYYEMKRYKLR